HAALPIFNGTVRDFARIVSSDSGKTFSVPRMVSNDNWIVDGCPHTGASMSADSDRLEVVWFTAGGRPGLYYSFSSDGGDTFASREFISGAARHPQLASKGGQSVIVAEENEQPRSEERRVGEEGRMPGRAREYVDMA